MANPASKVKVKVQRFVTTTVDSIKINGNVWWPTISPSLNPRELQTISDINKPCLLFVHQWSKMGGAGQLMEGMAYIMTLKNKYTSITFDMRGVGKSTGSSTWSGKDEINDVLSVCEWIKLNICKPVIIIGSSAGAPIAGSAFGNINYNYIIGGVFIGYPFGFLSSIIFGKHYNQLIDSDKPKLFIHGDTDGFTSVKQLNNYINKCKGDINEYYIEKDIGHFGLESPQYDDMVCDLIHQFINHKIAKNVDIQLWHDRINKQQNIESENNKQEKQNNDEQKGDENNNQQNDTKQDKNIISNDMENEEEENMDDEQNNDQGNVDKNEQSKEIEEQNKQDTNHDNNDKMETNKND